MSAPHPPPGQPKGGGGRRGRGPPHRHSTHENLKQPNQHSMDSTQKPASRRHSMDSTHGSLKSSNFLVKITDDLVDSTNLWMKHPDKMPFIVKLHGMIWDHVIDQMSTALAKHLHEDGRIKIIKLNETGDCIECAIRAQVPPSLYDPDLEKYPIAIIGWMMGLWLSFMFDRVFADAKKRYDVHCQYRIGIVYGRSQFIKREADDMPTHEDTFQVSEAKDPLSDRSKKAEETAHNDSCRHGDPFNTRLNKEKVALLKTAEKHLQRAVNTTVTAYLHSIFLPFSPPRPGDDEHHTHDLAPFHEQALNYPSHDAEDGLVPDSIDRRLSDIYISIQYRALLFASEGTSIELPELKVLYGEFEKKEPFKTAEQLINDARTSGFVGFIKAISPTDADGKRDTLFKCLKDWLHEPKVKNLFTIISTQDNESCWNFIVKTNRCNSQHEYDVWNEAMLALDELPSYNKDHQDTIFFIVSICYDDNIYEIEDAKHKFKRYICHGQNRAARILGQKPPILTNGNQIATDEGSFNFITRDGYSVLPSKDSKVDSKGREWNTHTKQRLKSLGEVTLYLRTIQPSNATGDLRYSSIHRMLSVHEK